MKAKPVGGLLSWANSHPILTTLLTFVFFTAIPITIICSEKLADNPYAWAIGACAVFGLGAIWFRALWNYGKNIVTVLLIITIMAAPLKQARAAMYGVGVVVICVGTYCVIKVIKICQKKFPPKDSNTNAPPEEFTAAGGGYGGACEYSSIGSCYQPPDFTASSQVPAHNPTTFTLSVLVQENGCITTMSADSTEGITQTWDQFQSEMANQGLFITGHPGAPPQFEMNGIPCEAWMVPLEFDSITGRVTHHTGNDLRRVTVERSPNLIDWYPLLVTDTGVDSGFKVVDTTLEGQMFYRVQVSQP